MKYPPLVLALLIAVACPVQAQDDDSTQPAGSSAAVLDSEQSSVATVGSGCGEPGRANALLSTNPVIGGTVGIQLSDCLPKANGFLVISGVPTGALETFFGCDMFVDPATAFVPAPFLTGMDGTWSLVGTLALPPSMSGTALRLQCVIAKGPTPDATTWETSNGLHWVLGLN